MINTLIIYLITFYAVKSASWMVWVLLVNSSWILFEVQQYLSSFLLYYLIFNIDSNQNQAHT